MCIDIDAGADKAAIQIQTPPASNNVYPFGNCFSSVITLRQTDSGVPPLRPDIDRLRQQACPIRQCPPLCVLCLTMQELSPSPSPPPLPPPPLRQCDNAFAFGLCCRLHPRPVMSPVKCLIKLELLRRSHSRRIAAKLQQIFCPSSCGCIASAVASKLLLL